MDKVTNKCTRCGLPSTVPGLCQACVYELDKKVKELQKLDPREPFVRRN